MRTFILILFIAMSLPAMVGFSATVSEVVLTHPDGTVTPPGAIATPAEVSAAASTQNVVYAAALAARASAEAVRAEIAAMHTNTVVTMTAFCQSANSASAIPDTNVFLRVTSLSATNGTGYLRVNSTKALSALPELRFAASIGPKESFTNIAAVCSWPSTVPNDPGITNGVSYLYEFTTDTPNGFYFVYADPMIIPPSGDYILVSGSININGYIGVGSADAPEILYDRDGKQLTLVGGTAVNPIPQSASTMMAFFGRVPVRMLLVRAEGGSHAPRL